MTVHEHLHSAHDNLVELRAALLVPDQCYWYLINGVEIDGVVDVLQVVGMLRQVDRSLEGLALKSSQVKTVRREN